MSDSHEKQRQDLLKAICALPENHQRAIGWIVSNYGFAAELCGGETLTEEQRAHHIKKALEQDDAMRLALVLLERALHEEK